MSQTRFSIQDIGKLARVASGPLHGWVGVILAVKTDNKTERLDRIKVHIPGDDIHEFAPTDITLVDESLY
jgi:hypothetical protein